MQVPEQQETGRQGTSGAARELAAMVGIGLVSLGATWAVTVGLTEGAGVDERVSYPIALVAASTLNFFACRHFIFEATDGSLGAQAWKFASSIAGFRIAEFLIYAGVVSAGADYQVTLIAIAAVSFVLKFLVAKFLVFKTPVTGSEPPRRP